MDGRTDRRTDRWTDRIAMAKIARKKCSAFGRFAPKLPPGPLPGPRWGTSRPPSPSPQYSLKIAALGQKILDIHPKSMAMTGLWIVVTCSTLRPRLTLSLTLTAH